MLCRATGTSRENGHRLYFSAGERTIVAEITEPALLEPARRLFSTYEAAQPGHQHSDQVDVILTRKSGSYKVGSVDSPDVLCKTQMDAIVAFEFALSRSLAAAFVDYVHLHASGAVVDGRAVLALGSSGAGKSSLAISMLSMGYPTLGDDTVLLNPAAQAVPFKRLLKVSGAVLCELGLDPTDTVLWDSDWPEVWFEPREKAGWAAESPVAVIALAHYDPNASLQLSPVPAAEALNAVVHSVMVTGMSAGAGFERLVSVVEGAEVVYLTFPSSVEAAGALCSLVR